MKVKDLQCDFHMPDQLEPKFVGEKEIGQHLPPYALVDAYPVDEYPACPSTWMNGSDISSSYFIPVEKDKGMWLNFNNCCHHPHNVAVVISIQGVNPITGQQTDILRLEKYEEKCPIHDEPFKQDMFCPTCKFKWPAQNYIATTGTPGSAFWLDGFRVPGGRVRQYIFTPEKIKGIANQLIGEDKVFAIGIAFYLSKEKKPEPQSRPVLRSAGGACGQGVGSAGNNHFAYFSSTMSKVKGSLGCGGTITPDSAIEQPSIAVPGGGSAEVGFVNKTTSESAEINCISSIPPVVDSSYDRIAFQLVPDNLIKADDGTYHEIGEQTCGDLNIDTSVQEPIVEEAEEVEDTVNLEIGAGALIDQKVYPDPKPIEFWEDKPAGMIYINYCDKKMCDKILKAGKRKDKEEGYLEDLSVG
ncbi:hypothetical protein LCGC14_1699880 [marine sediment metagenome]|uniref:Uncharacterized protein n=1 Tax=marine sediment metagenome TaxID=412755 RepID=A0A0F9HIX6_9ZZZZ